MRFPNIMVVHIPISVFNEEMSTLPLCETTIRWYAQSGVEPEEDQSGLHPLPELVADDFHRELAVEIADVEHAVHEEIWIVLRDDLALDFLGRDQFLLERHRGVVEHAVETLGTLADHQVHVVGCADEHNVGLFHHDEPLYAFVGYLSDAVVTVVNYDQLFSEEIN